MKYERNPSPPSPNLVNHEAAARKYAHASSSCPPEAKQHIRNLLESLAAERSLIRLLKIDLEQATRTE
jgi:hypothetical protein